MSHTYVKASCHCGLNNFQLAFTTSKLPQSTDLCHCNTCRHVTGTMGLHFAVAHGKPLAADTGFTPQTHKPADLSNLTEYTTSDILKRYFCKKCSAYVLYYYHKGIWLVSTGALEKTEGIVKVGYHQYVGDTLDGGLADHYVSLDGKELPRYTESENSKTVPLGWKEERIAKKEVLTGVEDDKLAAYCYCKTISLYLTRPQQEDAKDDKKWWLVPAKEDDPTSRPRFIAGHCFCNSCRLSCGALFQTHIILPRANVYDAHTSKPIKLAVPKDGTTNPDRPKGLKQYESTPGTFREACGTCGATVFYWSKNAEGKHMPVHEGVETEIIDLAAGLVDEEDSGARAERWVSWYDNIIHPEDALDKAGMEAIKAGIKKP